ncbi:MAG: inovirus-type Gp2 protein [Agitococcus sp.]|nr:inovirus-type Gp2 protein [Agitococcus sp.]
MLFSNEADTLIEIENLVNQVIKNEQEQTNRRKTHVGDGLGLICEKLMFFMEQYLSVFQPDYEYSEHLEAFWSGCKVAGLVDHTTGQIMGLGSNWPSSEQVGAVVTEIIRIVSSKQFKRQVVDRRYQANEKNRHLQDYAAALHLHYSRLLVVRVDWYYRQAIQSSVGISDVYRHLDAMIQNVTDRTGIFTNLVGYAWCIEQGTSRGYHLHTVFYFPGSDHQSDWYMAQQIGELWEVVTQGMGTPHNCNTPAEKEKYDRLGILGVGMIHRKDKSACANAVKAVGYLANPEKEDQYLRAKPSGRRAFATGQLPKARE